MVWRDALGLSVNACTKTRWTLLAIDSSRTGLVARAIQLVLLAAISNAAARNFGTWRVLLQWAVGRMQVARHMT